MLTAIRSTLRCPAWATDTGCRLCSHVPRRKGASLQVRLNVLHTLHHLSDFVSLEQVSEALLPCLDELSADRLWRVRHQLVALTPTLGQHLGIAFFQKELLTRTLAWLTDSAAIIRTTAASAMCEVANKFGEEWTRDHVLQRVRLTLPNTIVHCYLTMCLFCQITEVIAGVGAVHAQRRALQWHIDASLSFLHTNACSFACR